MAKSYSGSNIRYEVIQHYKQEMSLKTTNGVGLKNGKSTCT